MRLGKPTDSFSHCVRNSVALAEAEALFKLSSAAEGVLRVQLNCGACRQGRRTRT